MADADPSPLPQPNRSPYRTVYVADLACILCGTSAGALETERRPIPPHAAYRRPGATTTEPIADWRRLRCERCGGALVVENVDEVTREEIVDAAAAAPRRGRPPRWLVEQRRRAMEEHAQTP